VALNPLVLVHVVGGAHNDALMALLLMAGCAGVLALRELGGGGSLAAAAAVKVSAVFAAPFALLGARRPLRLLTGGLLSATLLSAAALIAFGTHAFDAVGLAGENQAKTSHYSVPATGARILGADVDLLRIAALVLYAGFVAWLLVWTRRGGDWLRATGWAALGLLVASGWLLPWYLIWALPFAALSRDRVLIGVVLALTAFQLINRVPL
jgi:alpha-1,6-mannosyltransferase